MKQGVAKKKRSQAAIFDGIMFLLLVTLSASLVFVSVSSYGQQQDAVMRSAHVLNYMQSVMKSLYYVNAVTLKDVPEEEKVTAYKDLKCKVLDKYLGSISVTDLLKRDLADPDEVVLDDKYGGIDAFGRTAMRCAAKELMKPFAFSGYKYFVEVIDPSKQPRDFPNGQPISVVGKRITNSLDPKVLGEDEKGQATAPGCQGAADAGYKLLSVSAPFRVVPPASSPECQDGIDCTRYYVLRVCIWQSTEAV